MKSFSFLILLCFSTHFCSAQEKIFGLSGSFDLGVKAYDTENYQYFMPGDAPPLDEGLITVGGGGYTIYRNWIIGGYGFFRSGDQQSLAVGTAPNTMEYNYKLRGGGAYFNLGYVLFSGSSWLFFPQLGIGVENLSLLKNLDEGVDFAVQQNLSTKYKWQSPMLEIALAFDFFPLGNSRTKFGLRAGYQLSLEQDNEWQHAGGNFNNPDLPLNNLDGFFVNLVIGSGYFVAR